MMERGAKVGPPRRSRFERNITLWLKIALLFVVAMMALSVIVGFLGRIGSAVAVIVGAVFFTYLVSPAVRRLRAQMPLGAAVAIVYLGLILLLGFVLAVIVPALLADAQSLGHSFPTIVRNAQAFIADPNNPILRYLPAGARAYLDTLPAQLGTYAERIGGSLAQGAIGIVLSAVTVVATLVVIPVISAYIMLEGEALQRATLRIIPVRSRARMLAIGHDLDHVLGGFVRGQVLVGAVIGTAITVMLLITHVRYALLIGVAAGILNIIPYVGSIVAFVPSVSLAFFYDGWQHAVLVAALFVAIFQLDGHFITPKIVSGSVGLTPLMVIVAILIGAELMGIAGMFLAVPIAGILRVLVMHAFGIATTETPAAAAAERPRTTTKASA